MDDEIAFVAFGLFLGIIVGGCLGYGISSEAWKKRAVENGKAEFYLKNVTDTEAEWRWKP